MGLSLPSLLAASLALLSSGQGLAQAQRAQYNYTALIIDSVQNFWFTGPFAQSKAPDVLPQIYRALDDHDWARIVTTQVWKPEDHVSFASQHPGKEPYDRINITYLDRPGNYHTQLLIPDVGIADTPGADIHPGVEARLAVKENVSYLKTGQNKDVDSGSAFADSQYYEFTRLDQSLRQGQIDWIVIVGLLTDGCVLQTAIDGRKFGFNVVVISDAVEASDDMDKEEHLQIMEEWGVNVVTLDEWEDDEKRFAL